MGDQKHPIDPVSALTALPDDSFDDGMLDSLDAQLIEAFEMPEAAKPRLGQQVDGRFVLEGELGHGGMGWVFSARHLATDGQVALKVMDPRLGPHGKLRFAMEARNAATLTHPNTVRVLDYGQDGEHPFLVMEFLRGQPLQDVLKAEGPLGVERVVSITSQILKSLWEAHDHEIVHRDIKPGNVFLISQQGTEDFVKVLDFGISHKLGAPSLDLTQNLVGSPYNMAPEQWQSGDVSPQTDLYAVGCLVYEMLCGHAPFEGKSVAELGVKHLQEDPCFDDAGFSEASVPLHSWIDWMMAKAAVERPPSAKHALQALQDAAHTDLAIPPRPATPSALIDTTPLRAIGPEISGQWQVKVDVPVVPASTSTQPAVRHNLQLGSRRFIGREVELRQLTTLLFESQSRLITIVGLGGVGKTTLIKQFAQRTIERWPGELWFCDLTKVTSLDDLWHAVTQPMGIKLTEKDHEKQFIELLGTRDEPLLLMDNFEQITHLASDTIAAWMAAVPSVTFAVTSREPLALAGEQVVRLSPFELPATGDDLETARQNDAVSCFVRRAREVKPDFALTEDNLTDVIELVQQLDGLALALELAAARASILTPAQIVARLSERFKLLRARRQDAQPHQTTLKGALDWSWEQMTPYEQEGLLQCSVFRGSFTLEAAEAVLDLSPWPEAPWTVDLLQSLLDKSWLAPANQSGAGGPRFKLFVTIREYALHQREARASSLAQPSDAERALTRRHAEYYCGLPLDFALWERNHSHESLAIAEHDNLMAVAHGPHRPLALEATLALASHYHHFGPYEPALNLLQPWLEAPPKDPHQHLRLLVAFIYLKWSASTTDDSRAAQALALAQELQDPLMEGWVWLFIAIDKHTRAQISEVPCEECFKALALGEQTGHHLLQGWTLRNLGIQYRKKGENHKAIEHYRRALQHAKDHPSLFLECMTSHTLGVCLRLQGELNQASDHYLRALELATLLGRKSTRAWLLRNLSGLYEVLGDHNQAFKLLRRARSIAREIGNKTLEGLVLSDAGPLPHQPRAARQRPGRLRPRPGAGRGHRVLAAARRDPRRVGHDRPAHGRSRGRAGADGRERRVGRAEPGQVRAGHGPLQQGQAPARPRSAPARRTDPRPS